MARNTGNGGRKGQVTNRTQVQIGDRWVKKDREGNVVGVKKGDGPYKGVTKQ